VVAETLRPNGELSDVGLAANSELDHDEDPDVSSVTINATGNNVSTEWGADFPTPTGNPTVGADLQEFRAGVEEFDSGQSGTPTARIELWENGTLVRAGSDTSVSTYAVLSFTWNANELATADGSLVQCKVIGTKSGGSPGARNSVRIGHVEWNVQYDAAGTTFFETLAVTGAAVPVLTQVLTFTGTLAAMVSAPVTITRMIGKTLAPMGAIVAEMPKGVLVTLSVLSSALPGLNPALLFPKALTATGSTLAALAAQFIEATSEAITSAAAIMRSITRAITRSIT
jgi:hypothetical protein